MVAINLLRPIANLMQKNDLIIVDSQLIPSKMDYEEVRQLILKSYKYYKFKEFVTTPLKKLHIEPMEYGDVDPYMLKKHPYQYLTRGQRRAYTVYYDFEFNKVKKNVTGRLAGYPYTFEPMQRIRLGHSIKYSIEALEYILRRNKFIPIKHYILEPEKLYGVVLAKKMDSP